MGRPSKHSAEFRERAIRLVGEYRESRGVSVGGIKPVAQQLGIHPETLRGWLNRDEIDTGRRSGTTTADQQRIAELERENRELRRANEILKTASAFFARELDPRPPR